MNQRSVIEEEREGEVAVKQPLKLVVSEPPVLPIRHKTLFEDSLLDTNRGRRRRTWATILSLFLQCFLVGVLVLVPLLYTNVLPKKQLMTLLVAPPPPPPPPAAPHPAVKVVKVTSEIENGKLRAPTRIPKKVLMIKETATPPPSVGVAGGVPGGVPGGKLGGVIGGILDSLPHASALPKLAKPTPQRVRVSQGVSQGLLIHRVQPVYPRLAKEARIQGTVQLTAIIAKDGTVKNLQLVSGHPMLASAAIDAVEQWKYRPYRLNGNPVEVETSITVNFHLG